MWRRDRREVVFFRRGYVEEGQEGSMFFFEGLSIWR